jgi:hypothetical protein
VLLEAWLVVYLAGAPAEESVAVYEKAFELPVYRPGTVRVVCERGERLRIETDQMDVSARGIINATGTWGRPFVPDVPGADRFRGTQMHTRCGDNGRGPFRRGLPPGHSGCEGPQNPSGRLRSLRVPIGANRSGRARLRN